MQPTILVTGANRGIGFEVSSQLAARGCHVIMTARDDAKIKTAAAQLAERPNASVEAVAMDVTADPSVKQAFDAIARRHATLDGLVNNAGGNYDYDRAVSAMTLDFARETFELNLFSVWRVTMMFAPLLKKATSACVVNVSSGAGAHTDTDFGLAVTGGQVSAYGVSKCAVNALTRKFAEEFRDDGIRVNAVCPGFTATFPGAEAQGARPVKDGAAGIVWAACLPPDGPTGGFFRDGKPIGW